MRAFASPPILWFGVLGVLLISVALNACYDDPAPTSMSTTTPEPTTTQTPAPPAATPEPTVRPTSTPTQTPVLPTATPEPTATQTPVSAVPASDTPFAISIDSDTILQEVFNAFTTTEQDCIRGALDTATLEAFLAQLVVSEDDTTEWDQAVYPCLAPETSRALLFSLFTEGMVILLGELGLGEEWTVSEVDRTCLREWLAGKDLAVLISEDPDGDFMVEAFSCFPDMVIDLLGLAFSLELGEEWTVNEEERTCLREWIADADMIAVFAGIDAAFEPDADIEFLEGLFACVPDLFITVFVQGLAAGVGSEWTVSEEERVCLQDWFADEDLAVLMGDPNEVSAAAAAYSRLMGCIPSVLVAMFMADTGMQGPELSEEERVCLQKWSDDVDWPAFIASLDSGDDLPSVIVANFSGFFGCVPDLFLQMLLAEGGTSLEKLSEEEQACFRKWTADVDWANFVATALADSDDLAEIAKFVPELVACAPHVFVERAEPEPTVVPVPTAVPAATAVPIRPAQDSATDREALVALYNATNGPSWASNTNWLSDAPLGHWYGAITDANGRVTALILRDNQLNGEVPSELGSLASLEVLDLGSNRLSGKIPPELGNLASLEEVSFNSNRLSGEIPPELGNLTNLRELWLGDNELSGEVPGELGSLTNLEALDLDYNQLSGCVPAILEVQLFLHAVGDLPFCSDAATGPSETHPATGTPTLPPNSHTADWQALVALYNATDGPNWDDNTNWLSDAPIGEWSRVTIDEDGRVTQLALSASGLSGQIPPELGNLSSLRTLYLSGNRLSGEIPPELGNLSSLRTLYLSDNRLSGEIPPELGNLATVEWLYLGWNELSGEIPPELGSLVSVERLNLGGNRLSGEIPPELGNLTNLRELWLGYNELSGEIPLELGSLATVQWLDLSNNQLSGEIPPELGSLASVKELYLFNNRLSGEIPPELGSLASVEGLFLNVNQLGGEIPSELGGLVSVERLDLSGNRLSGEVPPELGNLANLKGLWLYDNQLSGCVPNNLQDQLDTNESDHGVLPSDLGVLEFCSSAPAEARSADESGAEKAALVALYNATDGPNWANNTRWLSDASLGEWHGVTADSSGRISHLHLHQNQLSGEIPPELGSLTNLVSLDLSTNHLIGPIPSELGSLVNLQWLGLYDNQLTGPIPPELGNFSNLQELHLRDNQLTGVIPASIGNLTNLEGLWLYNNDLTGSIPVELGSLSNLRELSLYRNQLSGEITPGIGSLSNLEGLTLSYNQFTGEIPAELGSLTNLTRLWLHSNRLTGEIPPTLGNLTDLQELILWGNLLTGEIPAELGNLTDVEHLSLVDNLLSGELPHSLTGLTVLARFPFYNNSGLCAPIDHAFQAWLQDLALANGSSCAPNDSAADRTVLVRIYDAMGGDNWTNNTNWLSDRSIREWHDVTIDATGRVNALLLSVNQLTGEIPAELGDLSNLTRLWLHGNRLTGEIPAELGSLSDLRRLSLSNNELTGEIPTSIGDLTNLEGLWLYNNSLTGAIPAELGNLANLQSLGLFGNPLTGCVPISLQGRLDMETSRLGSLPFCPQ